MILITPQVSALAGKSYYVCEGTTLTPSALKEMTALRMTRAHDINPAFVPDIIVDNSPDAPANGMDLVIRLVGGRVCRPQFFIGRGPLLSYLPAIGLAREVWVSEQFKAANSARFEVLKALAFTNSETNWVMLDSPDMFELAKTRAKRLKKSARVLALVTSGQAAQLKKDRRNNTTNISSKWVSVPVTMAVRMKLM